MEKEGQKELKLVFLMCALLIFIRSPQLFVDARFWAEEGTYYFAEAYERGFGMLFYVYPNCGYYYLFVNLATLIAAIFPLWMAPYVTTYLAFGIQLLTVGAILFLPSYLFKTNRSRIWTSLFSVVGACVISEVWLNTVNSQVFFGIIGICILFADWSQTSKALRITSMIFLGLGCLSGAYCVILVPFFIVRYFITGRKKEELPAVIITGISVLIQGIVVIVMKMTGQMGGRRTFDLSFDGERIINLLLHQVIRPLFGYDNTKRFARAEFAIILTTIIILLLIIAAIIIAEKKMCMLALLSVLIYFMIFTAVTALSQPGGRYAVVSGMVLLMLLVNCTDIFIEKLKNKYLKISMNLIMVVFLFFSCMDFQCAKNSYLTTTGQPSWKTQIKMLEEKDIDVEGRNLKIWPSDWITILNSKSQGD